MRIFYGFFILLCCLFSLPTAQRNFAPERSPASVSNEDPTLTELALAPQADAGKLACGHSALMLSYLSDLSDEEIQADLKNEIEAYRLGVDEGDEQTKKVRRAILKDLEALEAGPDPRAKLEASYREACQLALNAGGAVVRTTGIATAVITSTLLAPVKFIVRFGVGIFKRDRAQEKSRSYTQLFGAQGNAASLVSVGIQAGWTVFLAGSPWMLAATVVSSIDQRSANWCRSINEKNPKQVKFCRNYALINKKEFEFSIAGQRAGVKLGKTFLKIFDFQSDEELNSDLCQFSTKKKFRRVRRAVERLKLKLSREKAIFKEVQIILSADGCPTLNVVQEKPELYTAGIVDGIPFHFNGPAQVPLPAATETCEKIEHMKLMREISAEKMQELKREMLILGLNPTNFAAPAFTPVQNKTVLRQPLDKISTGRNLVFLVAPDENQRREYEERKDAHKELTKKLQGERKKFKRLFKTASVAECREKNEDVGFDFTETKRLSEALAEFEAVKVMQDYKLMRQQAKNAGKEFFLFKSLKQKWEIVDLVTLNQLREAINDPTVLNVVVVSHGQSNGKLVDSRLNELPQKLFAWINPNLLSFSFFSCHSKNAVKNYDLVRELTEQPSFHPLRYAGYVDTASFLDENNSAPTAALGNYLKTLDQKIVQWKEGTRNAQVLGRAQTAEKNAESVCSIKVSGAELNSGAFSVKVNSKWVGTLYPTSGPMSFNFPCRWLKPQENSVFLEGANLVVKSTLLSANVQVEINQEVFAPVKVTQREDGTIAAIKFLFNY